MSLRSPKNKSIYDTKIVMLDINFQLIDYGNTDHIFAVIKTLKQLSAVQNLLLLTDCDLDFCIKKIKDWNLKAGYLITNSGAVIYNLSNKTILSRKSIDSYVIKNHCKHAIWKNLNFVINTKDNGSFIYLWNSWLISKYQMDYDRLFQLESATINDWPKIIKILESNEIWSLEILFYDKDTFSREQAMREFVATIMPYGSFNYSMHDSTLFIYADQCSKLISSKKLMSSHGIDFAEHSIYLAIDQVSKDLSDNSYFSIISDKLLINKTLNPSDIMTVNKDWIDWLIFQQHLWNEPEEINLKNIFDNYKYASLKSAEILEIQENKFRYLNLNSQNKEIFLTYQMTQPYLAWYKKKLPQPIADITRVLFWDRHVDLILNLLKTKRSSFD